MSNPRKKPKGKYPQGQRLLMLYDMLLLGRKLCSKEEAKTFNISRRTLERDLAILKDVLQERLIAEEDDSFGVSYFLNRSSKRWKISPWQILAVSVGARVTGFLSGHHFATEVEPILDQFRESLNPGEKLRLKRLEKKIHVVSAGIKDYRRNEELQKRLAQMLEGLLTEKPVDLTYLSHAQKALNKPARYLRVNLLGAALHRNGMYFIADVVEGDWKKTERRILLALDRIQDARCCQDLEMFDYPTGFSAEDYFSDAFAIWPDGKLRTVKVRIDPVFAPYARERFWHHSQSLSYKRDGSMLISLRVRGFQEIGEWVLSMGEHAEAITPKAFRKYVAGRMRNALAKYEKV